MKSRPHIIPFLALLLGLLPCARIFAQPSDYDPTVPSRIITEAKKYIGTPYHWGGKGPNAFDCAGFVRFIYARFGYQLASSCTPQYLSGMPVNDDDLQVADLVFFGGRNASRNIGHVGMVTEVLPDGSFYFIHAARTGVRISHSSEGYYSMRYLCACRLLPDNPADPFSLPDSIALDRYTPDSSLVFSYFSTHIEPSGCLEYRINPGGADIDTTPVPPDTLTVVLAGSVSLHQKHRFLSRRPVPAVLPEDPSQAILQADIAAAHLAGPILSRKASRSGRHRSQTSPQNALQLMYAGFDLMSLAQSEHLSLGYDALDSTMNCLDSMQISYAGIKGYCSTAVVERGGYLYGFCAFGHEAPTHYYRDDRELRSLIQYLRDTVDILIVSFHTEDSRAINDSIEYSRALQRFAHRAIDLGADLVYGHGYDQIRGLELYNSHLIAYGLGTYAGPGVEAAPLVEVRILPDGTFLSGSIHTLYTPDAADPQHRHSIINAFRTHTSDQSNLLISTAGIILRYSDN